MDILRNIVAVMFYMTLFLCVFFKVRNIIFVKRFNCKEKYKQIKTNNKKEKINKALFIIILCMSIVLLVYLGLGIIIGIFTLFMMIITLGGAAYVDSGANSTFYNNLIYFVKNYFSIFEYIIYVIYLIMFLILIKSIYINFVTYKLLNHNNK